MECSYGGHCRESIEWRELTVGKCVRCLAQRTCARTLGRVDSVEVGAGNVQQKPSWPSVDQNKNLDRAFL